MHVTHTIFNHQQHTKNVCTLGVENISPGIVVVANYSGVFVISIGVLLLCGKIEKHKTVQLYTNKWYTHGQTTPNNTPVMVGLAK